LIELLIKAATNEGDKIFIPFAGSGQELVVAKRLNRRFIGCEINDVYYKLILYRLANNGDIPKEFMPIL
jgi:DNA modification methylase